MIALIKGQIVSTQFTEPGKKDNFQAHHLISVLQINEKGDAEIVKVKDESIQRKWEKNKEFSQLCSILYWNQGGRSGLSCKVLP